MSIDNNYQSHVCLKSDMLEMIKKDIEMLKDSNDKIVRLTTILELQVDQSKERDKYIKQLSETLITVTAYISEQKDTLKKIEEKMDMQEDKLMEIDIKFERQALEQLEKYSFNVLELVKGVVPYLIGMGALYVIYNIKDILALALK